jgi:murein DD-endopeptidase MepM/ murein hydrolase activator NlpD
LYNGKLTKKDSRCYYNHNNINYISNRSEQLKNVLAGFLMILVKFLIILKRLISGLVLLIIRPLFRLIKFLLTKPLIKLYHLIFKLRKSNLAKSSWQEILRQRSLHILVFCLTITVAIFNFVDTGHDSNDAAATAKKTIVSHLIRSEFSDMTDDDTIIEETSNWQRLLVSTQETYESLKAVLINRPWISNPEEAESSPDYSDGFLANSWPINPTAETTPAETTGNKKPTARTGIVRYTVENGDTISSIANKFHISINTILWANNLNGYSLIRPGDHLDILPISGTTYLVKSGDSVGKIARLFGVEADDILKYNNVGNGLRYGWKLIIPGGKKLAETAPTPSSSEQDNETTPAKAATKSNSAVAAIEKLVNPKKAPESGAKLLWPTEGHTITQYYSWRHTAIDIANHVGTPLYAANAGTVIFAGWSTGYGNNVVIDHGNGMKTRYAHASRLFVEVGQKVDRGEEIAAMGSTGWSTGPHVHFEVIVNGVKYNPLNYVR